MREIVALQQFVNFVAALCGIEDFVGEVAAEEKRVAPAFSYRRAETVVVAIESDEDPTFTKLRLKIVAGFFALFRPADQIAF